MTFLRKAIKNSGYQFRKHFTENIYDLLVYSDLDSVLQYLPEPGKTARYRIDYNGNIIITAGLIDITIHEADVKQGYNHIMDIYEGSAA